MSFITTIADILQQSMSQDKLIELYCKLADKEIIANNQESMVSTARLIFHYIYDMQLEHYGACDTVNFTGADMRLVEAFKHLEAHITHPSAIYTGYTLVRTIRLNYGDVTSKDHAHVRQYLSAMLDVPHDKIVLAVDGDGKLDFNRTLWLCSRAVPERAMEILCALCN